MASKKPKRPDFKPEKKANGKYVKPGKDVIASLVAYHEARLGRTICGGWRPGAGDVCCQAPKRGRTRCRHHGGDTLPAGVSHPSFKHGLYSKALTGTSLGEAYEAIRKNEALLDLRDHVAMQSAIAVELVQELHAQTPPGETWKLIERQADKLDEAYEVGHQDFPVILMGLLALIREGADAMKKRDELRNTTELIRRLSESERRMSQKEQALVSVEIWQVNMSVLVNGMKQFFPPDDLRRFVSYLESNIARQTPLVGEGK